MTTMTKPKGSSSLFVDDHQVKGEPVLNYFAAWYDHAGRYIRRRLGPVAINKETRPEIVKRLVAAGYEERDARGHITGQRKLPEHLALTLARHEFEEYAAATQRNMKLRWAMSSSELEDCASIASYPRQVVAEFIKDICNGLVKNEVVAPTRRPGQPGLQVFSERTGISTRELHRIIEDESRVSVGIDIADKICIAFDLLLSDFAEESMRWAERTGKWSERSGTEDPWPIGYYTEPKLDELI